MQEFQNVLSAVLPVFFIAGAGALMRGLNWLTEEADQSLLRVTINLLSPCLILDSILHNEALKQIGTLLVAPLLGFAAVTVGLLVCNLARGTSGLKDPAARRTFVFCNAIFNYGYVPVPLVLMLFNRETVGVLFVFSVGVELAMWTLGVMTLRGQGAGIGWKKILNVPLVAILCALTINFFGGQNYIPTFVSNSAHMLGQCAIPMGLVLVGATIRDHLHEFHSAAGWRVIGASCALRLAVLPVVFLLAARYLPCPLELKHVMIVQAAMPAAVFPIVMARHYGGDAATALRVAIGTSAVGLVTIPFWIRFGMKFVGL